MVVYVLDIAGNPLMPTRRFGKVRRMLKSGKAIVVNLCPFVIKLTYVTTNYTQPITLSVDAGSIHVGLSASTEKREVYAAEVKLRSKDHYSILHSIAGGLDFSFINIILIFLRRAHVYS